MIEIKNLHYSYGKITALRGINLAANSGEITAIIGANGAGKSTMMKCIAGLLKPNIGEILCDGERLPAEPHNVVKRNIVLVPEGRWIFPNLTVEENLKMGAYTVKDNTENMEKAYAMFNRLGERKRQLAGTLSGGEQQMLAIARALMSNPKTILFDEPSLGLAPLIVNDVIDMIQRVNRSGISVIVVEQNAKKILTIANRAYVMEQGRIVKSGSGQELASDSSIVEAYLGGRRGK
jgi:branched-chain amino acid transport system ATP-binding protein